MKEFSIVLLFFFGIALIFTSIVYFDGRAKSNYLKKYKNIDMPWYEASSMQIIFNDKQ